MNAVERADGIGFGGMEIQTKLSFEKMKYRTVNDVSLMITSFDLTSKFIYNI